jgi:hypothetical protein
VVVAKSRSGTNFGPISVAVRVVFVMALQIVTYLYPVSVGSLVISSSVFVPNHHFRKFRKLFVANSESDFKLACE